jgi:hypothetical protein
MNAESIIFQVESFQSLDFLQSRHQRHENTNATKPSSEISQQIKRRPLNLGSVWSLSHNNDTDQVAATTNLSAVLAFAAMTTRDREALCREFVNALNEDAAERK